MRLKPEDSKAHNDLESRSKWAIPQAPSPNSRPSYAAIPTTSTPNNLGVALKATGDLDGAIAEYRTAAGLQPNDVNAHFNLGLGLMENVSLKQRSVNSRTALHLRPNDAKIRLNLGNALAGIRAAHGSSTGTAAIPSSGTRHAGQQAVARNRPKQTARTGDALTARALRHKACLST